MPPSSGRGRASTTTTSSCSPADLLASSAAVRTGYVDRFTRIMVDEFQDTNRLQLELLDLLGAGKRFVVGDDRQSIYGFRHASVEVFRALRDDLAGRGAALRLSANFRSRPEILDAVNATLPDAGEGLLVAGRDPAGEPRVEVLVVDTEAAWEPDPLLPGAGAPAKQAEARVAAARVAALVHDGPYSAGDVAVLLRAATDMELFQRALERHGPEHARRRGARLLGARAGARPLRLPRCADQPA